MTTDEARERVALYYEESMAREKEEDLFASHVTIEMKAKYFADRVEFIRSIRLGKLDHNFTIRQRMHYYLTGEWVPLLPK